MTTDAADLLYDTLHAVLSSASIHDVSDEDGICLGHVHVHPSGLDEDQRTLVLGIIEELEERY